MPIANSLNQTCVIERDANAVANGPTDAYHSPTRNYQPHLQDVRCRLVEKAQRVFDGATAESPVMTTYLLLLPAGTDARANVDRVTNVRDRAGQLIEAGPFRVTALVRRRGQALHHLSAALERT